MVTPQEVIDKVVFGGLYMVKGGTWSSNGGFNDQCYNIAVPIMDSDGNLWMQDTYQIDRPSRKADNGESISDAAIRQICDFGESGNDYFLKRAREYYYRNQRKIMNEDDLSRFVLICDLHDYRALNPWEDYREYKNKDIIHNAVMYRAHNFDWDSGRTLGATLVKKDAQKNPVNILKKEIEDAYGGFKYPDGYWGIDKIDEALELCKSDGSLNDELRFKAAVVKTLDGKLKEMHDEFWRVYKIYTSMMNNDDES